jgi:hypothetical protein
MLELSAISIRDAGRSPYLAETSRQIACLKACTLQEISLEPYQPSGRQDSQDR